jgi:hypothetical protein
MESSLPKLQHRKLAATRDYLQEVVLVIGSLQRAFIPKDPHDWHYGLEVGLRGPLTQPLTIAGTDVRASLDLVRSKVRLGGSSWSLKYYSAPEILNNIQIWLESRGVNKRLQQPEFKTQTRHFDVQQATDYATALWWMHEQFKKVQEDLDEGFTSPILLYPHHFDLSLVWFPFNDKRQLAIGFSTGDETIIEPYLYLTAYPEPAGFTKLTLPKGAHWQSTGFSGAILPYRALSSSSHPDQLFTDYVATLKSARPLFG